ncbi:MAG: rhomboid family intramembrane serine protease [Marinilabiliaceae bacterium]|nr:rhomboid family intramembrane serine protease [Marinilabiliaceae bacterium]
MESFSPSNSQQQEQVSSSSENGKVKISFENAGKRGLFHSLFFPLLCAFFMFAVRMTESIDGANWFFLGIRPLNFEALLGIITMPFVHADWKHLWNNLPAFVILSVGIFYFYRPIGYKVFFTIYLLAGLLLWFAARDAWHVGASGVIYGMAAFLFISGIFRRYKPLMAIALLVVFLYGSLIWGLFPWHKFVEYSWEGHFWGTFAGVFAAFIYRKQGPQIPKIEETNEDDEIDEETPYWKTSS